jgi:hypothetical protein
MHARRGFTLVDACAAMVAAPLLVFGAHALVTRPVQPGAPAGEDPVARAERLRPRDAQNIRAIHQAMVIWAQNHADQFPLPSEIDKSDFTVADHGGTKNTTANVYSLLLYSGLLKPDVLVSPLENNPKIEVKTDYVTKEPPKAVSPAKAVFDPSFAADFTRPGAKGNVSYAHLQPFGERLNRWSNTFVSDEIVVGGRAPEIAEAAYDNNGMEASAKLANQKSLTLSTYARKDAWAGHFAFNDNHVEFREVPLKDGHLIVKDPWPTYVFSEQRTRRDVWCYDEPGDRKGVNTYLGIFTQAGSTPGEWKAIWD